jgi:hypothetical protein
MEVYRNECLHQKNRNVSNKKPNDKSQLLENQEKLVE